MAAEYDFQRKPNPKGDGELQPMYPRIVNKGTITGKRLVSDISQATSFTPGDVEECLLHWKAASPITFPKGIMYSWAIWDISRRD